MAVVENLRATRATLSLRCAGIGSARAGAAAAACYLATAAAWCAATSAPYRGCSVPHQRSQCVMYRLKW